MLVPCDYCEQEPGSCPDCNGTGYYGNGAVCGDCGGSGVCPVCHGLGRVEE